MNQLKSCVLGAAAVLGGILGQLFGGWSAALGTLIVCMAVDYLTGMLVAGVFHASDKTPGGGLESRAGWKGLCRKGVSMLIVLIAHRLDLALGTAFVRDAVVVGYIANEVLSIVENAGLMGVPIPQALKNAVDALQGKEPHEHPDEAV
ncbi:MAG: phage holin family protein [Butyricicoccus sp.]|nr:phage holin family protein [Butyricicoccus sp.]MBQ8585844.1 phage holin family protein [Butyricicoccus sp.]